MTAETLVYLSMFV